MTKTAAEPTFSNLVTQLSAADTAARAASADSSAARERRSTIAVTTIKAAFSEKLDPEVVRTTLIDAGVLKGTVSKIVTVLRALEKRILAPEDVNSLNGAYNTVKMVEKIASTPAPAPAEPFAVAPEPVVATTPNEALEIIIASIKSITDPDEALKAGGEWMTKVTNAITVALKEITDAEEGE